MSTQSDNQTASAVNRSSGWVIFVFFLIGLIASMITGWTAFPKLLYSTKEQPIDFSHKVHIEQLGDCRACHFFRDDGSFSGAPSLDECKDCHMYPMTGNPNEQKFIEEYIEKDKEVPWLNYAEQPPCVFFSHAAHVKGSDMQCETCHGDMGHSDSLREYQENRITGYSRDIWGYSMLPIGEAEHGPRQKMNDCAACHLKKTGSKGDCFQCHK
ncbi:MAG: cytochrome C [Desulfobacteraceae bacterium]|nr:cytochrome C [Desulfobacteraceae bacterium]MCF8093857.1 cytochrome C [Desulfobacteraceae bacterium]